ncbi:high-affinity branched chain amino acid ABC transporter ATP-binding protein [Clostridium botulinum CFSAN002369]|nr:high-affinity branched chain amino acid ABC transporter ATP-binding protein [Clostridium botulinum CFSAN002369]
MNILEVKDLNINFGGITAIDNLNFSVKKERY